MNKHDLYNLMHQAWLKSLEGEQLSLRLSTPARARTIRRAVYIERQRIAEMNKESELLPRWNALRLRVSGPYLTIEAIPPSPATTELRSLLEPVT